MKPSHLAALMLAAATGGLLGSPAHPAQTELVISNSALAADLPQNPFSFANLIRGVPSIQHHPASWQRKNQRQIRLNRRRANAAGARNAFA